MTDTIKKSSAERAVERGAAFLDNEGITDWRKAINVADLDLADPDYCVLGQVFNSEARQDEAVSGYSWAIDHLEIPDHEAVAMLGFEIPDGVLNNEYFDEDYGYAVLTEAWLNYLTKENAS